jgi:hypothetical protein
VKVYSPEIMEELSNLRVTVDFNEEYKDDLSKMTENNWKREKKRSGKRRDYDTVKMHTAMGLGFEKVLLTLPYFGEVSEIVDDAMELNFIDRMRDYKYLVGEGCFGQQKTFNLKYSGLQWYINYQQLLSLLRSAPFNEHLMLGGYREKAHLVYEYQPAFLMDMKSVIAHDSKYIKKAPNSQYDSYIFDWQKAVFDGVCIKLIKD